MNKKIGLQIALPFVIFTMTVFAAIAGGAYHVYTQENAQMSVVSRIVAHTTSIAISSFFDYLKLNLTLAAQGTTSAFIKAAVPIRTAKGSAGVAGSGSTSEGRATVPAAPPLFLSELVSNTPALLELDFFDVRGREIFHVSKQAVRTPALPDIYDDPYIQKTIDENGDALMKSTIRADTTPQAFWYFPLRDASHAIIGVMRASIDLSVLARFLSGMSAKSGIADLYIVDERGMFLIANTPHSLEGAVLADNVGVSAFLHASPEEQTYTGISGSLVHAYWEPLPPSRLGLIAETPQNGHAAIAREIISIFLVLTAVLSALILYELLIVRRELLNPLSILIETIGKFRAGMYKTRAVVPVGNELAVLAQALNEMAENIDRETSIIVERLRHLVAEQDMNAKLLLSRDRELALTNNKLRDISRMKSEFVSIVAHQLRTPLSAIKWIFGLLIDGDAGTINVEQKSLAMKGYESNERLIGLVNDLLDVDRLESGTTQFSFGPVDIGALIENIVLELEPRAESKRIAIRLKFSHISKVRADQAKLRAVLQNLIENAVKYTSERGVITVATAEKGHDAVMVSVSDTGIGIPESEQKRIFSKFFRASNAQRTGVEGTGLGLSLVRPIIERHGGAIWFESAEGVGTTFHFTVPAIPLAPAHASV